MEILEVQIDLVVEIGRKVMTCARPCRAHSQHCGTDFLRKVINVFRIQWVVLDILPMALVAPISPTATVASVNTRILIVSQVKCEGKLVGAGIKFGP